MGQEWTRNGSRLSEMGPDIQKWVRNGPEMGPDYQKWSGMDQKWDQIIRNGSGYSEMNQKWDQITRNGSGFSEWVRK